MKALIFVFGALLALNGFANEPYPQSLPSVSEVIAAIQGENEDDAIARRLAAMDALGELVNERRPGGRYSYEPLAGIEADRANAYVETFRSLYAAQQQKLAGDDWKTFYRAYMRYSADKDYKLSVIQQLVPSEAAFMSSIYEAMQARNAERGAELLSAERRAFWSNASASTP